MKLEARVTRKTRDLVLDSAQELLWREVPEVSGVRRAEVWTFDVEDAAADDVRRVLEETTLVVNPNVHRYTLERTDEPTQAARVTVRVTERVDPKSAAVLRGIRQRVGAQGVRAVARSVEWSLDLVDTADGSAARIGEEVAAILGNRHAQDVETRVSEGGAR